MEHLWLKSLIRISPAFIKICPCEIDPLVAVLDSIRIDKRNDDELEVFFKKVKLGVIHQEL